MHPAFWVAPSRKAVMSAIGTKRTWAVALHMSAFDPKRTFSWKVLMSVSVLG